MNTWADKKVLVLGLGETGLSLVRWLSAQGAIISAADSRAAPPYAQVIRERYPDVVQHCGSLDESLLGDCELVAISPGVPLTEPLVQLAGKRGVPVIGDVEILAQTIEAADSPKPHVIAITGANGKSTVTSMVGAMCRAAGMDTAVAGNISPAVLDALQDREGRQPEVWVLELSSFQLESTHSLQTDAATVLNVSQDHLDRHADFVAYVEAKARIFSKGQGVQVLNRDDLYSLGLALPGRKVVTFGLNTPGRNEEDWSIVCSEAGVEIEVGNQPVMSSNELRVSGLHNVANAMAALALCRAIDLPLDPLVEALRSFRGLPHRTEQVAEINGVNYYDDSKGTNVGATVAALNGMPQRAVLIAGGDGKGQDFSPLHDAVAGHARAVVLIGRDAEAIGNALRGTGVPIMRAHDMQDAVRKSASLAWPGDAVLLSPACASFDMFRNYEHRAEVFKAAVHELQKGGVCVSPT